MSRRWAPIVTASQSRLINNLSLLRFIGEMGKYNEVFAPKSLMEKMTLLYLAFICDLIPSKPMGQRNYTSRDRL